MLTNCVTAGAARARRRRPQCAVFLGHGGLKYDARRGRPAARAECVSVCLHVCEQVNHSRGVKGGPRAGQTRPGRLPTASFLPQTAASRLRNSSRTAPTGFLSRVLRDLTHYCLTAPETESQVGAAFTEQFI